MSGKVNLDRWGPHLVAAKREGKTLAQYARERGLSPYTLYAAREMMRREAGKLSVRRRQRLLGSVTKLMPRPAFAAVRVLTPSQPLSETVPRLRAQLPNGVKLELTTGSTDAVLLAAAIQALSGR